MDVAARNELIIEYLPLVKFIAGRVMAKLPQHVESGDLISAGIIGLIDAIGKFDAEKNAQFKTYAEFRIKGAMLDELRALDFVPRSVRETQSKLERARAEVEQRLGRAASEAEIAEFMGLSGEEFDKLLSLACNASMLSLNEITTAHVEDDFDQSIMDCIADPNVVDVARSVDDSWAATELRRAIDELPDRQRVMMTLYYYEGLGLLAIGKMFGISESGACQIHRVSLAKLRTKLAGRRAELCAA